MSIKKRRMHITQEEGEVILMSLSSGIEDVKTIMEKDPSPYWRMLLMRMKNLQHNIQEYKWITEE